jgi:hypothetical protein
MTNKTIQANYYVFDSIEKNGSQYFGKKGDDSVEVYPLAGETDVELVLLGFAKCDAEGTETFVVEETAWAALR